MGTTWFPKPEAVVTGTTSGLSDGDGLGCGGGACTGGAGAGGAGAPAHRSSPAARDWMMPVSEASQMANVDAETQMN